MKPLNILHLEDNPIDAELIAAMLAEEGLDCQITVIEDGEAFTDMLANQSFDLILADYTLPSFDGLSALKVAKESNPLIPFILVSGTLGEEIAIESLKTGATDYVLKTSLSRLAPAVKRAILEAQEHATRIELEKRLQQAQKMEAIGTLAGGIAHDFNNILSAVLGYGELALLDVQDKSNISSYLQEILKAGHRATDLVRQILAFSRKAEHECTPMLLQPLIKEVLKLLRATIPATIKIQQEISPECGHVLADPTQMHQIIMNLCTNSFHAMRDLGGILSIKLLTTEITDGDELTLSNGLVSGKYLKLTVTDTGCGMANETLGKMFDPYFTTKKQGEGTGLGMAVVHGIITSIGGAITAHSTIGEGTAIHIYIPQVENTSTDADQITRSDTIVGGKERVLVVDDEAELAIMLQDMLSRLGYEVTMFTSPEAALDAVKQNPDSIDMVITDMTMPDLTGMQLAIKLFKIRPQLPIILCSGFSENMNRKKAKEMGIKEYLLKPVTQKTLGEAVRTALDQ